MIFQGKTLLRQFASVGPSKARIYMCVSECVLDGASACGCGGMWGLGGGQEKKGRELCQIDPSVTDTPRIRRIHTGCLCSMLCYAMLCYAMLCYAMPCHATLCMCYIYYIPVVEQASRQQHGCDGIWDGRRFGMTSSLVFLPLRVYFVCSFIAFNGQIYSSSSSLFRGMTFAEYFQVEVNWRVKRVRESGLRCTHDSNM